jgi:hypothetical protein
MKKNMMGSLARYSHLKGIGYRLFFRYFDDSSKNNIRIPRNLDNSIVWVTLFSNMVLIRELKANNRSQPLVQAGFGFL